MKRAFLFLTAATFLAAVACLLTVRQLRARQAAEWAAQQNVWLQEKAGFEKALEEANASAARLSPAPLSSARPAPVLAPATPKATPAEIIARLRALRFVPGQSRAARQAIHDLEELIAAGPAALPAIREFLARHEDVNFDAAGQGKRGRGVVANDFVLPPSLRFGLFDVVRRIGGDQAEAILALSMNSTGRGMELAWLARALQEMAPDEYRDAALAAARELLARPWVAGGDRTDRDQLFSVLAMYGDNSYVSAAQTQLVQADGGLDRSALKYLQELLGPQAVPIAAQMYNDPRLTDPSKKEPLARLALNFVGTDAQANEFFNKAINDLSLPKDDRRNLIEDLNQDGFVDRKNLSTRDLPLIENRIAIIEQLGPSATDPVNLAAFKEAYKDLLKMRERIVNPAPPKPAL